MPDKKKAFTLIGLIVVIAVIGLLATISVIALNDDPTRDGSCTGNSFIYASPAAAILI